VKASRAIASLVLLASLTLAASASAQSVRYRRPFFGGRSVSAYFDHAAGGCRDWACGGVCYDGHSGTDFPMPVGTAIAAAAVGTVITSFNGCGNYGYFRNPCGGRCGNHVVIRHDDGSTSRYCHMRNGSIRVGVGARVNCGQVIGESASSGSSTGPHLHFGHNSPGSSASDPYAGPCSRANSLWMDQGGYRGNPAEACQSSCSPSGETCNNNDDDCDGRVDEGLSRRCGSDVGVCRSGTQTCGGGGWGGCAGSIGPTPETCDGRDEDCDGATDEATRSCGTDVGECVAGIERCVSAAWGSCEGSVDPVPERCDLLDNDCDGENDDERICEREEAAYGGAGSSTRDSDASGDGAADACALTSGGFLCVVGNEHGFHRTLAGGELDASDFFEAAAIRMGDLDGDGHADVCGRQGDRLACWRSDGTSFDEVVLGPTMETLTSLGLVDIDGDGRLDACLRDATGMTCHRGTSAGFGTQVTLPALADDAGFADVIYSGSVRFGDVNGDERTDVCARDAEGLSCWLSEGDYFGARVLGPRWSDEAGFAELGRWSTLRLADVNGDGMDDACIRAPEGFRCTLATGRGFGDVATGPAMNDEAYERTDVYSTIRMGDLDGDGRADVCVREPEGMRCWLFGTRDFDRRIEGPELSDADGWALPARYRSIRLADVSGDGRADLCGLAPDGLRCWLSTGTGFDGTWLAMSLSDASLNSEILRSTLRIAGGGGRPLVAVAAGCGCTASRASRPTGVLAALLVLGILRARRARRAR